MKNWLRMSEIHHVVRSRLAQHVSGGSIRHSYLVSGPEGVGKQAVVREFAMALMCDERGQYGQPCGSCEACRKVERGTHPDVALFSLESQAVQSDAKSKNTSLSVETVRSISAAAALRPYQAKWRVIVVDDVETMQRPAQEAFLKTVEEPPEFLVILLLTDTLETVSATLRSRCEVLELSPASRDEIVTMLTAKGLGGEDSQTIAGLSFGLPDWASAAASDPDLIAQQSEALESAKQWIAASPFDRIAKSFELTDRGSTSADSISRLLQAVAALWRGSMLDAAGLGKTTYMGVQHVVGSHSDGVNLSDASVALKSVLQCSADLHANVRPRLALEAMVTQWPEMPTKGAR